MYYGQPILVLARQWRDEAETLRRYGSDPSAVALEACASALEEAVSHEAEAPLTLTEAAERSGYSAEHLGRLVRDGKIPNAGRSGAPRIAGRDLPIKPKNRLPAVAPALSSGEITNRRIVQSIINEGVG